MASTARGNDRIVVTVEGGVADVRLDRPEKMNALDAAMFDALVATSAALDADPAVRAVVLSGNGRAFCAGLDLGWFAARTEGEGGGEELLGLAEGSMTSHSQQAVHGWTEMAVPVIAAIHGPALGGGLQIALGADIRFVAPDASMSVLEVRWGTVPDMGGTRRLVELVGLDVAKELTFTGRMVDGSEAVELGLATHLAADPHAGAMAMASEIASKSPDAIRASKRMLRAAPLLDDASAFAMERREVTALIGSANQAEAAAAYFENRAPNFSD